MSDTEQVLDTIFNLELLIDIVDKKVIYNQTVVQGNITQNPLGIIMVYDEIKEYNAPILCNNKDLITREVIKNGTFVKYHICCSRSRVDEFKQDLVNFAMAKETELLTTYQTMVTSTIQIISELNALLPTNEEVPVDGEAPIVP